jgi:4-amino-4-deoxy-L-arabinose transferase-like glycosyltransferase
VSGSSKPVPPWIRAALAAWLLWSLLLRLAFAWPDPTERRWIDERFNVANVVRHLATGELRPENFYYGTASWLPQAWLLAGLERLGLTDSDPSLRTTAGNDLAPRGYHLMRLTMVVYGLLSLGLVFLLGRHLLGPHEALLATILVGSSLRHIQASAVFKPDILLLVGTLAAVLWACRALERPSLGRWALAGLAVGLATAAKLTGWIVALPVALACLVAPPRWPQRLQALAVAGGCAAAHYWAWNPWLEATLAALRENQGHYRHTATGTHLEVLLQTAGYPFDAHFLGPVLGALALLGVGLLVRQVCDPNQPRSARVGRALVVLYPLAFWLLYALSSPRAKPNHFLQVLPFLALWAAAALLWAWQRFAALPMRGWLPQAVAGLALLAVTAVPVTASKTWVYQEAVPTTQEVVARYLQRALGEPLADRLVVVEATAGPLPRRKVGLVPAVLAVPPVDEADPELRLLADAWVAPAGTPELGVAAPVFGPQLLRSRGPALAVERRELALLGEVPLAETAFARPQPRLWLLDLPPTLAANEVVSLRLTVSTRPGKLIPAELRLGGAPLPFASATAPLPAQRYLSARFRVPATDRHLALQFEGAVPPPGRVQVELLRWSEPRQRPEPSSRSR